MTKGKSSLRRIPAKAHPAPTIPLRHVTVVWNAGKPGERTFTGSDLARLMAFATAHGGVEAATRADQSGMVEALGDLLGTLNSASANEGNEFWLLEVAAKDIAARLQCPRDAEAAERYCENFVVTLGAASKAVA